MLISEDYMLSRGFFGLLNRKWGPHTVDLFASNANNMCAKFFSLHWCRGSSGINAFGHEWSGVNCWIRGPCNLVGKVWKTLQDQKGTASMLIPFWKSAPWWQLVCPDACHFAECVVDWVWLPRDDPSLFVAGTAPGRAVLPPVWQFMAVRLDF